MTLLPRLSARPLWTAEGVLERLLFDNRGAEVVVNLSIVSISGHIIPHNPPS